MQRVFLDTQLYSRTAQRFSAKVQTLPPDTIRAVASDIVTHLGRADATDVEVDPASVAEFCTTLLGQDASAALDFISDRRAEGCDLETIYVGYIAAAARELGARCEEDRISLFDVAMGTGHLYALMRSLRAESEPFENDFDVQRYALFATVPGEDHAIGITIAADLFRAGGWEIDLHTGTDHAALLAHAEFAKPRVIGLSLTTERRLDSLVRLVVALRLAVPRLIIAVATGGTLHADRVTTLVDIDLHVHDVRSARVEIERLLNARAEARIRDVSIL